jgi:hypothetical protein
MGAMKSLTVGLVQYDVCRVLVQSRADVRREACADGAGFPPGGGGVPICPS